MGENGWKIGRGGPRVVSLLPSATEVLCAVGGRGLLVGRSHECDWPVGIEGVPVLTGVRGPGGGGDSGHAGGAGLGDDSATIDARVRAAVAAGEALYTLDEALLASLRPDVILTQDLCAVCSIDLAAVRRVAARLSPRPEVVSLDPHTVEDVLDDHLTVGRAVGLEREATAAAVGLRERLFAAGEYVNPFDDGQSVAFLEWTDPLFVGGHWTVQMIERAGGRHPLNPTVARETAGAAAGPQHAERVAGKSVRVSVEALVESAPEWIVVCPCGMGMEATRRAAAGLRGQAWWGALPAVRAGRVALVDGNQMFNRPGPRLVEGFEFLVGWLNGRPAVIPEGFPWERMG